MGLGKQAMVEHLDMWLSLLAVAALYGAGLGWATR